MKGIDDELLDIAMELLGFEGIHQTHLPGFKPMGKKACEQLMVRHAQLAVRLMDIRKEFLEQRRDHEASGG